MPKYRLLAPYSPLMPNENTSAIRYQRQAIKLSSWSRFGAAALGLAGVGSGGVAVFIAHVEAGPVALIAAGTLFLLIAMGGIMPTRLKVGDNEAEWINELQDAASAVAINAATGDRDNLSASLDKLNGLSPSLANSMAALIHTARCYGLIEMATDGRDDVEFTTIDHNGTSYMILAASNGNRALVQPMVNYAITTASAIDILKDSIVRGKDISVNRIFLLLDEEPSGELCTAIDKNRNITTLVVRSMKDFGKMIRGVERSLDLDPD